MVQSIIWEVIRIWQRSLWTNAAFFFRPLERYMFMGQPNGTSRNLLAVSESSCPPDPLWHSASRLQLLSDLKEENICPQSCIWIRSWLKRFQLRAWMLHLHFFPAAVLGNKLSTPHTRKLITRAPAKSVDSCYLTLWRLMQWKLEHPNIHTPLITVLP